MFSRSATFISGLPAVVSSPFSAYLTNTVPPTAALIRHFAIRSSRAAICASSAAALPLMVDVLFSSVESVADSCSPSTCTCASMSSCCFCVAAPLRSMFSTRCSSLLCVAICLRSDATCFSLSGRLLRRAACWAASCLRCRCS